MRVTTDDSGVRPLPLLAARCQVFLQLILLKAAAGFDQGAIKNDRDPQ